MGAIGFLFPGLNAEKIGMGKDLYNMSMPVRQLFETAERSTGLKLMKLCFFGPEDQLHDVVAAQVSVFLIDVAATMVLRSKHITAQAQFGLGPGLYAALVNAGVVEFNDALLLVKRRGEVMKESMERVPGVMLQAGGITEAQVRELCEESSSGLQDRIVMAVRLHEELFLLSGSKDAVVRFLTLIRERQLPLKATAVPNAGAWHSPLMTGGEAVMAGAIAALKFQPIKVPTVCPATGSYFGGIDELKQYLAVEAALPLAWERGLDTLRRDGCMTMIETGPGQILGGWVRLLDRSVRVLSVEDAKTLSVTLKLSY